jgi:hypothetical protein
MLLEVIGRQSNSATASVDHGTREQERQSASQVFDRGEWNREGRREGVMGASASAACAAAGCLRPPLLLLSLFLFLHLTVREL